MVVFPLAFLLFIPLADLWLMRLQGKFPILKTRSFTDLYPLIRPPTKLFTLGRGRILIPGFIRFPPTLELCDVAHSLPLEIIGRDFLFTGDETWILRQLVRKYLEIFEIRLGRKWTK
jgi:hypothetical protein